MPKATLKEVAARAGVSYQTVSKVLNKQAQVTQETEERIMDAVRALGYRPNQIARNMRMQRTHLIGYSWAPAASDQANTILDLFLQSMAQAAEKAGYHILCFPFRGGDESISAYQDLIDTNRVDGFVISSVEYDDPRIAFLKARSFPFVAFGRSNPDWDFPYVDVDGADGMRQVVEYLVSLGHRRIAALAWPEASRVGQNRFQGFAKGLADAGLRLPEEFIARGEGNYEFGFTASAHYLDLPEAQRPTAIVTFNDWMAIGAMHAVQARGLRVGVDVAITGFDDAPMVQHLTPPLTTICQPVWEIGQQVINLLFKVLDEAAPEDLHVLLKPHLVVRQSCGEPVSLNQVAVNT